MTITLKNVEATNANLPSGLDYRAQLAALPELLHAWDAIPGRLTMATPPLVAAILDTAGGSPMVQGDDTKRPSLVENVILGKWPAIQFGGDDLFVRTGDDIDFSQAFTLCGFVASNGDAGTQRICSALDGLSEQTALMFLNPGLLRFMHGNGFVALPCPAGEMIWIAASSNGSTLKLSINGGPIATAPTNNDPAESTFCIGAAGFSGLDWFKGLYHGLHMLDGDLFATEAGARALDIYAGLGADYLGVDVV